MGGDRRRTLGVVGLLLISLAALVVGGLTFVPLSAQEPGATIQRRTSMGPGGALLMTLAFVYGCVFLVGVVQVIRSRRPADPLHFWPLRCMVFLSYGMILASLVMVGTVGERLFLPFSLGAFPNPSDVGAAGGGTMFAIILTGQVLLYCLAGEGVLRVALVLKRWLKQRSTGGTAAALAQQNMDS